MLRGREREPAPYGHCRRVKFFFFFFIRYCVYEVEIILNESVARSRATRQKLEEKKTPQHHSLYWDL